MLSLTFGLIAACAWAVHDLLVRKIGQEMPILPMLLVVMAAGCVVLSVPALIWGDWSAMTGAAVALSVVSGAVYILGIGGLYRAFSMAPVRLVAPILGAYPMLTLGLAALGGRVVTTSEILAVLGIVLGIAIVGLSGRAEGTIARPMEAIFWAVVGAVGFALTFWLVQEASRQGSELPANMIGRLTALVLIVGLCLARRVPMGQARRNLPVLCMMGALDALALGLINASARLPHPEYAAVSASLFGVLTILLAWRLLKEQVLPLQWLGIGTVFAGIAALSSLG